MPATVAEVFARSGITAGSAAIGSTPPMTTLFHEWITMHFLSPSRKSCGGR